MSPVPEAKVEVPECPPELIDRAALRAVLDEVDDIGLLCAPAGYGKTSLMSAWARASTAETAWVSIDQDDNDSRRLWSAVLAAVMRCPAVPPGGRWSGPWEWPAAGQPEFLAQLVSALEMLPGRLHLILDDVHELVSPEALRGVEMLLRNCPPTVVPVLSGRVDPPVGLQRLRLGHRIRELRADRLGFSVAETDALMRGAGLPLTRNQVDLLHERTGGWPAGLRLATMAIAQTPDVEDFLAHFSGDEQLIADYLVEEVFSVISEDTLDFLRKTSVTDPLPADLAAALSGRVEAGSILDKLAQRTGLVHVTGRIRDTYRLQPLMRSYLVADLHRQGAGAVNRQHAAAACWWAEADRPIAALDHAIRSTDPELVADTLHQFAVPMLLGGEHRSLRSIVDTTEVTHAAMEDPWLAALSAILHGEAGDLAAAQEDARSARRNWPRNPPAELAVLRAAGEELGGLPRQRSGSELADEKLPPDPGLAALGKLARGAAALRDEGDSKRSRADIVAALDGSVRHSLDYLTLQCLAMQGLTAGVDGDLRAMREAAEEALVLAAQRGWQTSVWTLSSMALHSYSSLARAEPAEATRIAGEALTRGPEQFPTLWFALRSIHAGAVADLGDPARGLAAMRHARVDLGDVSVDRRLLVAAASLEFAEASRLGHHIAARSVQRWVAQYADESGEALLMRASLASAEGRHQQARIAVRQIIEGPATPLFPPTLVEALLHEASLAAGSDERPAARAALHRALEIAEPLDLLRPFVAAGLPVRALLAEEFGGLESADTFAGRALAAGRSAETQLPVPLSERESTVLALLSSLLSLEEIAADLTVSINTVKSHVRSIYSKLGVSSRRKAVLMAHEHGLISPGRVGSPN